ncbi:hypothetical protein DFH08DRAFT_693367, partial [Mycena albidolilacea]
HSAIKQGFPPKSKFSVDDLPDLSGQVIIVTGANIGVGKETVKALLQHNAKVYLAARSPEKAKEAIDDLKSQTGKEAEFLQLDLADLHSVKRAVEKFTEKETRLDVLFNNGGVMGPPIEQLTAQGYDLTFGTNVLGASGSLACPFSSSCRCRPLLFDEAVVHCVPTPCRQRVCLPP